MAKEETQKEEKIPTKEEVAKILIERSWYLNLINFLQKAFNISSDEMARYVNGTKPDFSKETIDSIVKKLEKSFSAEQPKAEDGTTA